MDNKKCGESSDSNDILNSLESYRPDLSKYEKKPKQKTSANVCFYMDIEFANLLRDVVDLLNKNNKKVSSSKLMIDIMTPILLNIKKDLEEDCSKEEK